jgi:hypothetical protein
MRKDQGASQTTHRPKKKKKKKRTYLRTAAEMDDGALAVEKGIMPRYVSVLNIPFEPTFTVSVPDWSTRYWPAHPVSPEIAVSVTAGLPVVEEEEADVVDVTEPVEEPVPPVVVVVVAPPPEVEIWPVVVEEEKLLKNSIMMSDASGPEGSV